MGWATVVGTYRIFASSVAVSVSRRCERSTHRDRRQGPAARNPLAGRRRKDVPDVANPDDEVTLFVMTRIVRYRMIDRQMRRYTRRER